MKKIILVAVAVIAIAVVMLIRLDMAKDSGSETAEALAGQPSPEATVEKQEAAGLESAEAVQSVDKLVYSEENLSDAVKELLRLGGEKQNYNSLEAAIGKLSKDLSVDDVAALRDMLTWPNDKFPEGMRDIEINAIKNDVLDRLLRQTVLPDGIGLQMVEMASNPDNDPVWRDYCVQFMTPCYERLTSEYAESTDGNGSVQNSPVNNELDAVREAMFASLNERDCTIAGTSLIGLELLSRTHDEFDREAITDSALDIASDESASAASRMTAMRLAAGVGPADNSDYTDRTAETARLIAQTGETVLLRSAAIVTLGEIGTDADRELLESFTTDGNRQIATAAQLALEKMDAPDEPVVDRSIPTTVTESTTQPPEKEAPILIN